MTLENWVFFLFNFGVWVLMPMIYGFHTFKLIRHFRETSRAVVPNDARLSALDRVVPLVTSSDFRRGLIMSMSMLVFSAPISWFYNHGALGVALSFCICVPMLLGITGSAQWRELARMRQRRAQILSGVFFEQALFSETVTLRPELKHTLSMYTSRYSVHLVTGKRVDVGYGEKLSSAKRGRIYAHPRVKIWGFRVKQYFFFSDDDLEQLRPENLRQSS